LKGERTTSSREKKCSVVTEKEGKYTSKKEGEDGGWWREGRKGRKES